MSLVAHGFVHSWTRLPFRLLGLAHVIAEYHNGETGHCYPSVPTLAERGDADERTVRRMLRELEARGVITIRHERDERGRQISSQYDFHPNPETMKLTTGGAKLPGGADTGVRGGGDTGVTPIIRNKESYTILADCCATPQAACHPPPPHEESKGRLNGCPYEDIRSLWVESCPGLPQPLRVENWTEARKAKVRARWNDQLPTLDHWRTTFELIANSDFLTGKTHNPKRKPFRCTLWWISNPENLSRLYEGDFDNA